MSMQQAIGDFSRAINNFKRTQSAEDHAQCVTLRDKFAADLPNASAQNFQTKKLQKDFDSLCQMFDKCPAPNVSLLAPVSEANAVDDVSDESHKAGAVGGGLGSWMADPDDDGSPKRGLNRGFQSNELTGQIFAPKLVVGGGGFTPESEEMDLQTVQLMRQSFDQSEEQALSDLYKDSVHVKELHEQLADFVEKQDEQIAEVEAVQVEARDNQTKGNAELIKAKKEESRFLTYKATGFGATLGLGAGATVGAVAAAPIAAAMLIGTGIGVLGGFVTGKRAKRRIKKNLASLEHQQETYAPERDAAMQSPRAQARASMPPQASAYPNPAPRSATFC